MNRRDFFGLLGKLSALAVGAKVMPFTLPPRIPAFQDYLVFDRGEKTWYDSGTSNWSFKKTFVWTVPPETTSNWTDPKNWSEA